MKRIKVATSEINGKGMFAEERIAKGERIQFIKGPRIKRVIHSEAESEAIKNWIGAGKHLWVDTTGTPFRYINHSCYPNAAMTGTKTLVALEDIAPDEEITIDYAMTDADPYWSFTCHCGVKQCRGEVRAIFSVPTDVFKRHFKYVSKSFQKIYFRHYILSRSHYKKTV